MIYLIINPTAGGGKSLTAAKKISKALDKRGADYKFLYTTAPYHAEKLTKIAISQGAKTIVAVGGDGTILETMQGFIENDINIAPHVNFGIIPVGSGNDFIRKVNIPKDINKAVDVILDAQPKKTDIIQYDGGYCLNIASVGIDAEIANWVNEIKNKFGKYSYLVSIIKNILSYKAVNAEIKVNGKKIKGRFTLMAICNGSFYGGGFHIAPMSEINDGKLTFCYVDQLMFLKILVIFPLVAFGKHVNIKYVHFEECKEIEIKHDKNYVLNIDGNIVKSNGKVRFKVIGNAINLLYE